ncbi:HET-domain-containing protein [Hypoxylon sp. FL0543]|nr:HET-domain-containing protein [Hypoxylon sp. FL0543]
MHLLDVRTKRLKKYVSEKKGEVAERYGILSHRWLSRKDEILFQDVEFADYALLKRKRGFFKLASCCKQARRDGLKYVWIDSCCINRMDSTEVQESINSMYRWYANADRCYVYLKDTVKPNSGRLSLNEKEDWFKRGWTLQELMAPEEVLFFDRDWYFIGDKTSLKRDISSITGIAQSVLEGTRKLEECSIAERMSWASGRNTRKDEDRAYSLLGLFDVNMPMLYGEGEVKAFLRLQEEIIKVSDDHSIFAWKGLSGAHGLLATSPEAFRGCNSVREPSQHQGQSAFSMTNRGFSITLNLTPWVLDTYVVLIHCTDIRGGGVQMLGIFLRRLTEDDQYARVSVDGEEFYRYTTDKAHKPSVGSRVIPIYIRQARIGTIEASVAGKRRWVAQERIFTFEPGWGTWLPVGVLELFGYGKIKLVKLGFDYGFNPTLLLCESTLESESDFSTDSLSREGARGNKSVWKSSSGERLYWNPVEYDYGGFSGNTARAIAKENSHLGVWALKGDRINGLDIYLQGTGIRVVLAKTLTKRRELVWDLKLENLATSRLLK